MQQTPATTVSFDEKLAEYKELVEAGIADFCDRTLKVTNDEFGDYSAEAITIVADILKRGGKRVRGALVLAAYEMCGGKDLNAAMPLALAMEIFQVYLLIADDIYDRSATRRGGPTAHIMLRDLHAKRGWLGDSEHFGESIAGCATLIANNLAMEEIAAAPVSDHAKVAVFKIINEALRITDHGQINDIFNEATRDVTEAQVEHTLTWKAAYYSFIGPLVIGGVAAGATEADLTCLREYGRHMGLSFQVADDIIGTFGDEHESGKSNTDDLREGKMTVLIARALANATPKQRTALLAGLGNADLTKDEYETCKRIITETGALEYARKLAVREGQQAVEALSKAPATWQADKLDFLRSLAGFVVNRHS